MRKFNPCYFCKKSTHVSEYCRDFPTLKSRYSEIFKRNESNCLCPNYNPSREEHAICVCKIICEACFQHHHISVCPKKDPEHPLNPIILPQPLSLFSHHSPFAIRFFELSPPINQCKLRNCCQFFRSLQYNKIQLQPVYSSDQPSPLSSNVLFNKCGNFKNKNNIAGMKIKNCFNFDSIHLENCFITKRDLKLLAKSDPFAVALNNCKFDSFFEFQEILDAFPYAIRFHFVRLEMPQNLMLNFLCSERKVGLREIIVRIDYFVDFQIDDMIMLYEQNENLVITIEAWEFPQRLIIGQLKNHARFFESDSTQYDIYIFLRLPDLKIYFKFLRLG